MPFRRGIMTSGFLGLVSDAPTGLSATSGANTQSVLAWTAPANNGGSAITDYVVQYSTDNTNWTTFSHGVSSSPGITVTGLGNGTLYYFRVAAITAYGTGAYLGTTATPYTVPSAPATATLSAGTGATTTDTFTWIAPANNGSAITKYGYNVSQDNGSSWGGDSETANLTYGIQTAYTADRFSIRVRAFNSAGWGAYSSVSAQTVRWELNPGTETQGPQTITGTESVSQTDTDCSHSGANCSSTDPTWCECGQMFHTRTRTASRTRSRSRSTSSSRYRSRSTNFYSRTGNNNSATSATTSFNISDTEWNLNTSGTTGYTADTPGAWSIADPEWGLGSASGTVGWGGWTHGDWGAYGPYGACNQLGTVVGKTGNFSQGGQGYTYDGPPGQYSAWPHPGCADGCDWSVAYYTVTVCNETGTNTITYQNADVCRNVFGDPC